MKKCIFIFLVFLAAAAAMAQEQESTILPYAPVPVRDDLPTVGFKTDNRLLMKAFYPEYYANDYLAGRDIRWVDRNDSALTAVWDSLGYDILVLLEELSGIKWQEKKIEINLMKYFRDDVLFDPPCMPLEGIKMENYIEVSGPGLHRVLDLIKLLAGRNLMQNELPGNTYDPIINHPLMEKSSFRFDVLAVTLTMACAEQILPADSLQKITNSTVWRRHNPGWEIYQNHFRYTWVLSPDRPLVFYLSQEPYDSPLVGLTRAPRPPRENESANQVSNSIKMSAGGGKLGFSVARTPSGLLQVVDVDTLGIAYSSGLMPGDQIKRVNGEIVRNARDLMSKILDKLNTEGVYLIVNRDGHENGLLLVPTNNRY